MLKDKKKKEKDKKANCYEELDQKKKTSLYQLYNYCSYYITVSKKTEWNIFACITEMYNNKTINHAKMYCCKIYDCSTSE